MNNIANGKYKACPRKVYYCFCPGSRPGVINIDRKAHLPDCRFHKKRASYTDVTVPLDFGEYGYGLGTVP